MPSAAATLTNLPIKAIVERLEDDANIAAAYLLGSAAENRLRADSDIDIDIDIAILPTPKKTLSALEKMDLSADLTDLARRQVDLGLLHTGNLVYAKEAVARGRLIFDRDPATRVRFEALVFSMYAELQENRREILHAYAT
jgi:predicted nucleotidyltransferase